MKNQAARRVLPMDMDTPASFSGASGRHKSALSPGMPSVVIGIGHFGHEVLAALNLAGTTRLHVTDHVGLWAGPDGWSQEWTDEPALDTWPAAAAWWQEHGDAGAQPLQTAILEALKRSGMDLGTLTIYLIAHINDPFGRELWMQVLSAARAAYVPFSDHLFTLILATDSPSFPLLTPLEARSILGSLDVLAAELLKSADEHESPGRVGWCYLLDTLDIHGSPLKAWQGEPAAKGAETEIRDSSTLQAHMVAEFIALLSPGLDKSQAYQRTSLASLSRDLRNRAPAAWVSSFAAGSLVLPIPLITERARDDLAHRLLTNFIIRRDMPGDLPAAQKLRTRWLAECTLDPRALRSRISRDQGGQPLIFPVEPPGVKQVPDERLVDHLLNWDTLLWGRWSHREGPPGQMARNADGLLVEADGWLTHKLEELLQHEVGGARLGALFIREAELGLEEERQKPDSPTPAEKHWLSALLARLRPTPPDPTMMPDLEAKRRELESALCHRLNRRAVWMRASLSGAALVSFAWAVYLVLSQAFDWNGLAARWVDSSFSQPLDLALLVGLCWTLATFAGWLRWHRSESIIHRATDRMITAIRLKYGALMERALRAERERVYAGLQAALVAWTGVVKSQRATLDEAVATLTDRLSCELDPAPLLTEQSLVALPDWLSLAPRVESAADRGLAERFLNMPARSNWRVESGTELAAALQQFADTELAAWRAGLNLESWATQPGNPGLLSKILEGLRPHFRPAWPLSRRERAGIVARLPRASTPSSQNGATTLSLSVDFVGLPASAQSRSGLERAEDTFSTGEFGRLAFIPTLHALELERLHTWEGLKTAAALGDGDAVKEDKMAPQGETATSPKEAPKLEDQPTAIEGVMS